MWVGVLALAEEASFTSFEDLQVISNYEDLKQHEDIQLLETIHNLLIPQAFYKNFLLYEIFWGKGKYLNEIHYYMEGFYDCKGS